MAAPSTTRLFCKFQSQFYRISVCRTYASYSKRRAIDVMSPEEEVGHVKHKIKPVNPKTNPYVQFRPDDPVQKSQLSLYELSRQSWKEQKRDKYFMKKDKMENQTASDTARKRKPQDEATPKSKTKIIMSNKLDKHASKSADNEIDEEKLIFQTRRAGLQMIDPNINYTRLDGEDKLFGQVIQRATLRNTRGKYQEIILEGRRLIKDALDAGAKLKSLFFSGRDTLHSFKESELQGAPIYKVLHKHMKIWSGVDTPQGLIGVFSLPEEGKTIVEEPNRLPVTLICDEVREPGNMGTLLRSAAAVGCQKIITSKGCVDIWNNKVVRAGAGCHFRIPIIASVQWSDMGSHVAGNSNVFLADCRRPTPELLAEISGSEKAAEAIEKHKEREEGMTRSSYRSGDKMLEASDDENSDIDDDEQVYKDAPISVTNYDKVSFDRKETVLIIGGETQGISTEARKFAYDNYGQYVTLPMLAGVDSLNCAVAGSVILYEMGKQLRLKESSGD